MEADSKLAIEAIMIEKEKITVINTQAQRTQNLEALRLMLDYVSSTILKVETYIYNTKPTPLAVKRTLKYFKFVEHDILTRYKRIQRAIMLRAAKTQAARELDAKLELLLKTRSEKKLEKQAEKIDTRHQASQVLLRQLPANYDIYASKEERDRAILENEVKQTQELLNALEMKTPSDEVIAEALKNASDEDILAAMKAEASDNVLEAIRKEEEKNDTQ